MTNIEQCLGNILAVVFGDGGHAIDERFGGDMKLATEEAIKVVYSARAQIEEGRDEHELLQKLKAVMCAAQDEEVITFEYTNWKRERGSRRALPLSVVFGKNEYHQHEQFLMEAIDLEKGKRRTFAIGDMVDIERK